MSNSFQCPFCQSYFPLTRDTYSGYLSSFDYSDNSYSSPTPLPISTYKMESSSSEINIEFFKCPACGKTSTKISATGSQYPKNLNMFFYPLSLAKQLPDYIPTSIKEDYEEAYRIVNLSPKASATLSRRCLQGMISDFWGINERTLYKSIDKLKDKIPSSQWEAVDSVRKIGNIGAHMENDINLIIDIDPKESEILLQFIELLIRKWYIVRHDEETTLKKIVDMSEKKSYAKKGKTNFD